MRFEHESSNGKPRTLCTIWKKKKKKCQVALKNMCQAGKELFASVGDKTKPHKPLNRLQQKRVSFYWKDSGMEDAT